jgi:hypothetical protein
MVGNMIICYASGYTVSPGYSNSKQEIADCLKKPPVWSPSTRDFEAAAAKSSAPVRYAVQSLQMLLDVLNGQPTEFISRLVLIGHANLRTFSFGGAVSNLNRNRGPQNEPRKLV